MSPRLSTVLLVCTTLLLGVTAAMAFGPWLGISDAANAFLTIFAGVGFMIMHGGMALGWRRLAVFVAVTVLISFGAEALGVATGWVFGNYHYTDHLGPKILGVPPFIQAGYAAMSYASLVTARIILGALGTPRGWRAVAVAFCGALIMVSWDVAMDPYQSTLSGDWIWENGGPYFGVPLHNYAGWFGTVFAFLLVYMGYETANPLPPPAGPATKRWFWAQPVVYYALLALGIVVVPLVGGVTEPIAAPQNYLGSLSGLMQSLSLVAVFVMGTPVALALARLWSEEPK